jgi:hypothetical protein
MYHALGRLGPCPGRGATKMQMFDKRISLDNVSCAVSLTGFMCYKFCEKGSRDRMDQIQVYKCGTKFYDLEAAASALMR